VAQVVEHLPSCVSPWEGRRKEGREEREGDREGGDPAFFLVTLGKDEAEQVSPSKHLPQAPLSKAWSKAQPPPSSVAVVQVLWAQAQSSPGPEAQPFLEKGNTWRSLFLNPCPKTPPLSTSSS
jgi:hypothetical protein